MNTRLIWTLKRLISNIVYLFALFTLFSCDQPKLIVEPSENDDQILLISARKSSGISIKDGPIDTTVSLNYDSALVLTYKRFEDFSVKRYLVELFNISLVHKLVGDTTLDYGSVAFVGMQLYPKYQQFPVGAGYQYHSMFVNNSDDSSYGPWLNDFRLDHSSQISSVNSPHINDFEKYLPTIQPNWFMNLDTGQTVSVGRDLEIVFRRNMVKGTVILVGSSVFNASFQYVMVQPASRVIIPAQYLQTVKGTASVAKCQIAFDEILFVGSLTTENKTTFALYQLPIFEFTRGSIMIRLTD
jgi:hypothetical protein